MYICVCTSYEKIEKRDTALEQPRNCTNHTLIHSPPESFESQKACSIECPVHTCHFPPTTDYDTTFTAIITFQVVLKQNVIEQCTIVRWKGLSACKGDSAL